MSNCIAQDRALLHKSSCYHLHNRALYYRVTLYRTGLGDQYKESLIRGAHFLDVTQVRDEVEELERHYRHRSVGAWPFSTRDHGWPISGTVSSCDLAEGSEIREKSGMADGEVGEAMEPLRVLLFVRVRRTFRLRSPRLHRRGS